MKPYARKLQSIPLIGDFSNPVTLCLVGQLTTPADGNLTFLPSIDNDEAAIDSTSTVHLSSFFFSKNTPKAQLDPISL